MDAEIDEYLGPTFFIDSDNPAIEATSHELARSEPSDTGKARAFFYFVRDRFRYNMLLPKYLPDFYKASFVLTQSAGYCVQKAILFAALCRAAGIPAGLGFATIRNDWLSDEARRQLGTNVFQFHGYAVVNLDHRWLKATPAFDIKTCRKNRLIPVDFDGTVDAVFHALTEDSKPHIAYLEDLGGFPDLPYERLVKAHIEDMGEWFLDPPKGEA
jgi:transglutaminase-like putative cysteine protease